MVKLGAIDARRRPKAGVLVCCIATFFILLLLSGCGTKSISRTHVAHLAVESAIKYVEQTPGNNVSHILSVRLISDPYPHKKLFGWPKNVLEITLDGILPLPKVCSMTSGVFKCQSPRSFHTATVFIAPSDYRVLEVVEPALSI